MKARPFRVLVVANDRKMLRRLSRFLAVFGFQVDSVADVRPAMSLFESSPPDFLIVDSDTADLANCRPLFSESCTAYTYSFLMVSSTEADRLTDAIQAGVDDFLAKPLVFGELLARLRSGARVLEYERRIREQSAIDPVTGLLGRAAFWERVTGELNQTSQNAASVALIDIDFYQEIAKCHGSVAAEEILHAVAIQLKTTATDCKYLANFGEGRLAALLPAASDAESLAWSETVREAIAALQITVDNKPFAVTASLGVASTMQARSSCDELMERAAKAVQSAAASGRNCVARYGQFEGETREWEDMAKQGRLFDTTLARDVMVPSPVFARQDQDAWHMVELLERSGLREIPVVDRSGALVGIFSLFQQPSDQDAGSGRRVEVGEMMVRDVATVSEDAAFSELMEFFMTDSKATPYVIVLRRDRPLGIIYRSGLAALSEPLTTATFTPAQPYASSSDFLLVTEGCSAV